MEAKQLQVKDFCLGNKIQDNNGFEMYVVGIFEDEILLDFEGNEGDVFQFTGKEIDLLNPIHLSEDVLLRLGFEIRHFNNDPKRPLWWIVIDNRHIDIYINNNGGYYFHINSIQISIPIIYVHQIQNLVFSLTGEELTFKK